MIFYGNYFDINSLDIIVGLYLILNIDMQWYLDGRNSKNPVILSHIGNGYHICHTITLILPQPFTFFSTEGLWILVFVNLLYLSLHTKF